MQLLQKVQTQVGRLQAADTKNGNHETAGAAISDGNSVEFVLCARDEVGCMAAVTTTNQIFPDFYKLLMQPSIWIGDTAAMMDMTPHDIGMVNKCAAKESVSIIMGNKQVEKSITIGDIPSVICNNQCVQIMQSTMKDVELVPNSTFKYLAFPNG